MWLTPASDGGTPEPGCKDQPPGVAGSVPDPCYGTVTLKVAAPLVAVTPPYLAVALTE